MDLHLAVKHRWRGGTFAFIVVPLMLGYSSAQTCRIENGGTRAACNGLGLTQMPTDIPAGVYYIDLSQNAITSLQAGDFDGFTSLLDLNIANNAISSIESGTWSAQITRTNDPTTFLPLLVLNMTGNPSSCSIFGSSPSMDIACTCANGFDIAAIGTNGRPFCETTPTTTMSPTTPPTSAAPTLAPTAPMPTTPAPTPESLDAWDRVYLTLSVSRAVLPTSYWVDTRPPFGTSNIRPRFETSLSTVLCSERGGIYSTVAERNSCSSRLRAVVLGVTDAANSSAATQIDFYVSVNESIISGQSVVSAVNSFTPADLTIIFQYPLLTTMVSAQQPTHSSVTDSSDDEFDTLTFALVTIVIIVIVNILLAVVIFAQMRLRRLTALFTTLQQQQANGQIPSVPTKGTPRHFYGAQGASTAMETSQNSRPDPGKLPSSAFGMWEKETQPTAKPSSIVGNVQHSQTKSTSATHSKPAESVSASSTSTRGKSKDWDNNLRANMVLTEEAFHKNMKTVPVEQDEATLRTNMSAAADDFKKMLSAMPVQKQSYKPPAASRTKIRLTLDEADVEEADNMGMPHHLQGSRW